MGSCLFGFAVVVVIAVVVCLFSFGRFGHSLPRMLELAVGYSLSKDILDLCFSY